jgi:hypothetical protein
MEDTLSFLNGAEEPEIETVEVAEEEPQTEAVQEQPIEAAPVEESKPDPIMVPLAALHETRDKVRELEAKLAAQQQPAYQPPEVPDVYEDPQGFQTAIQTQVQQAIYAERLNMSQRFAEQKFGAETVKAALEWGMERCSQDQGFNTSVLSNPDPVGFAIQQYQREQIATEVNIDEFQQFKAWKTAQAQVQQQSPQVVAPPPPPRSLASAPSVGGASHEPSGPGRAFDSLFSK